MKRIIGIFSFFSGAFWFLFSFYIIANISSGISNFVLIVVATLYLAALKVTKFWSNEITGSWNNRMLGLATLANCIYYIYFTMIALERGVAENRRESIILIIIAASVLIQGFYFYLNYKKRFEKIKRQYNH